MNFVLQGLRINLLTQRAGIASKHARRIREAKEVKVQVRLLDPHLETRLCLQPARSGSAKQRRGLVLHDRVQHAGMGLHARDVARQRVCRKLAQR